MTTPQMNEPQMTTPQMRTPQMTKTKVTIPITVYIIFPSDDSEYKPDW
jgi:hypothetical protein